MGKFNQLNGELMVVYLVGAGPGDPDLVTLKAIKVLEKADVVVYDRLANEEILKYADGAEMIYVGKRAGSHSKKQEEINEILIQQGKKHERVVRLKGGDPFVFGRGGEEMLALLEEGIPVELVPGVTSAIAVPTTVGLPVTHRGVATSFTVVTGHEDPTKTEKQVKWNYNADTIVILMGVGHLKENTQEIMKYKDPQTPVCVIEKGTTPDERIITGTLENITEKDINAGKISLATYDWTLREQLLLLFYFNAMNYCYWAPKGQRKWTIKIDDEILDGSFALYRILEENAKMNKDFLNLLIIF